MVQIFSSAAVQQVLEQTHILMQESTILRGEKLEPTIQQLEKAMGIVVRFIKSMSRVVYGGYAWDVLRGGAPSGSDIDFYSSQPIHDVKALCDMLMEHDCKDINSKNSVHEETYSVFLGPQKLCDISYMPRLVLRRLPTSKSRGILIVHPKIITIDVLRMLSTPVSAYWRLEKTLERATELFQNYPITIGSDVPGDTNAFVGTAAVASLELAEKILAWTEDSLLWVGDMAVCMYTTGPPMENRHRVLEALSSRYLDDIDRAMKILAPYQPSIQSFHPFLGYWGRHALISVEGQVVLRLYDSALMGFHYALGRIQSSENHCSIIRVASAPLLIFHLLVQELHGHIHNFDMNEPRILLRRLLLANPLMNLPVTCHGRAVSAQYQFLLRNVLHKTPTKSAMTSYRPASMHASLDPDQFRFKNTSGSPIG